MEIYLGVGADFSEDKLRFTAQIGGDGDTDWGHGYWAWAVGHMRGVEAGIRLQ